MFLIEGYIEVDIDIDYEINSMFEIQCLFNGGSEGKFIILLGIQRYVVLIFGETG